MPEPELNPKSLVRVTTLNELVNLAISSVSLVDGGKLLCYY